MTSPVVSVIIVARDRADDLLLAIESLEAQRAPGGDFEIIAVDDGSVDATDERLRERAARPPSPGGTGPREVVPIRLASSVGPGAARNAAAKRARAPLLAFLDSDARALPGWLEALLAPFADPGIGAVGAAEALDPAEPAAGRVVHFVLTSALTTGGLRGRAGAKAGRYLPRSFGMAVRRDAFERSGGFRAMYYGEDIDLSHRISAQGLRLVFAPAARVHHRRRRTLGAFLRQVHAMGRARASLARHDRAHLELAYLLPAAGLLLGTALAASAVFLPELRPAAVGLAAFAVAYTALVGLAATATLRMPGALVLAPLFFLGQQLGYATGFLRGVVSPARS